MDKLFFNIGNAPKDCIQQADVGIYHSIGIVSFIFICMMLYVALAAGYRWLNYKYFTSDEMKKNLLALATRQAADRLSFALILGCISFLAIMFYN